MEIDIVWEATLDDRYDCKVIRTGEYTGTLTVTDTADNTQLLSEDVGLSYQARFGPDISDVALWEDKCIAVVPELEQR